MFILTLAFSAEKERSAQGHGMEGSFMTMNKADFWSCSENAGCGANKTGKIKIITKQTKYKEKKENS